RGCPLSILFIFAGPPLRGDKPFPETGKAAPGTLLKIATSTQTLLEPESSAQRRCKVAFKTNSVSFGQIEAQLRHRASSPQFQMPAADEARAAHYLQLVSSMQKCHVRAQRRFIATQLLQIALLLVPAV